MLLCELKKIAREWNVRVVFRKDMKDLGMAYFYRSGDIIHVMVKNQKKRDILSTFFHELAHVYCWRNKIYYAYHRDRLEDSAKIIRTAVKAERYCDKLGCKLMKKYYPRYKFVYSYNQGIKEWTKETLSRYHTYVRRKKNEF